MLWNYNCQKKGPFSPARSENEAAVAGSSWHAVRVMFSLNLMLFLGSTQCENIVGDWREKHGRVRTTSHSSAIAMLLRPVVVCAPSGFEFTDPVAADARPAIQMLLHCRNRHGSQQCGVLLLSNSSSSSSSRKNSHLTQLSVTRAQICCYNDHVPAPSGQFQPHDMLNDVARHSPHSL